MPAKKNQQTDFSNLTNIIQAKFPNLLLGLTVIVALLLVVSFFTDGQLKNGTKKISWNIFNRKEMKEEGSKKDVNVYTVKAGDHLWSIAENAYGSGYNAYDIAKANNLSNPSLVEVGQKLKLPLVEAKTPTKGEMVAGVNTEKQVIKASAYVVKDGDYLWKIAEEAYGDGMAWSRIAQANKIANPNVIYTGTRLSLPR